MHKAATDGDLLVFEGLRLVGGQPALDLLNTVKYRGQTDSGERLLEFSDITRWARLVGIIDFGEFRLLDNHKNLDDKSRTYRDIINFREHVRVLIEIQDQDPTQVERAVRYVEGAISKLQPTVNIHRETGMLTKSYPIKQPADLKFRIVSSVDALLQHRDELTIKTCSGIDCDWVFADKTKAGRRKWCDTRTCGNLARVRKFRKGS